MDLKTKAKKENSKKGPKQGGAKQHGRQKKDLSKVKCFACHGFGHYVGQSSNEKKKKKETVALVEIDEYAARFEREFYLCAGHSERASITSTDVEDERENPLLVGHSLNAYTTTCT